MNCCRYIGILYQLFVIHIIDMHGRPLAMKPLININRHEEHQILNESTVYELLSMQQNGPSGQLIKPSQPPMDVYGLANVNIYAAPTSNALQIAMENALARENESLIGAAVATAKVANDTAHISGNDNDITNNDSDDDGDGNSVQLRGTHEYDRQPIYNDDDHYQRLASAVFGYDGGNGTQNNLMEDGDGDDNNNYYVDYYDDDDDAAATGGGGGGGDGGGSESNGNSNDNHGIPTIVINNNNNSNNNTTHTSINENNSDNHNNIHIINNHNHKHNDNDNGTMAMQWSFEYLTVPQCASSIQTYCEDIDGYPADYIEYLMRRNGTHYGQLVNSKRYAMPFGGLQSRFAAPTSTEDMSYCNSNVIVVYPKIALSVDKQWNFVINHGPFSQGVRIELCTNDDMCRFASILPNGYKSQCRQKFMERTLVSLDKDGNTMKNLYQFPSHCECVLNRNEHT